MGLEEVFDVGGLFGFGECLDAADHAHDAVVGVDFEHLVPVGFDEVPCGVAVVAVEHCAAGEEWGVLGTDFAVEAHRQGVLEFAFAGEGGEEAHVASFLLGSGGVSEASEEDFVVAGGSDDGDGVGGRGGKVGFDGCA